MGNSPPSSIFRREHLRHAAAENMLVVCACRICKYREAYVARDLLAVYGDMPVESFGSAYCGKCGGRDCVRTHSHSPVIYDLGKVEVIRPVGWEKTWHWQRQPLELPLVPLPDDIDRAKTASELEVRITPREPPTFEDWTKPVGSGVPRRRR